MKKVFFYLKPHYPMIALGLTIKFFGTIMDLLLPWILAHIIDEVIPMNQIRPVLWWGGAMIVFAAIGFFTNVIANRMASKVSRETTRSIRHDLFQKIISLSCRQVDEVGIPSLISRLTSDTYNIHSMVGMMQRLGVRAPILLIGGVVVTFLMEPVLTLALVTVIPLIGVVIYFLSAKGIPLYTKQQQAADRMVRTVRENITGVRIIKALSKTSYEKERFAKTNQDLVEAETKAARLMAYSSPAMNLFLNLGLTLVIFIGAHRVNSGLTQPGKIIAFLSYFTIILNAMLIITRIFSMVSKGTASAARIERVLEEEEDLLVLPEQGKTEEEAHITFEGVDFSYLQQQMNLKNISFQLKRGETLGIIGATGSGKSTFIKLLLRFYDADQGTIRINGKDVKEIPREELYTQFGIVFQNDVLFADTLEANVDFGRGLPKEKIHSAISFSQAEEFVQELPQGLSHKLAIKGANLSGGQKQRVLIARALAGNPEILILDDSSSALDYQTDAKLRKALQGNFQGVTTLLVAQRISAISHAHRILVLEEGEMVGLGTHEELLKTCRVYQEISESQRGGETDES